MVTFVPSGHERMTLRQNSASSPALPTSPCADWMFNSYSKYAETTQEDIDWYFNNKSIDNKQE